jgi:hypothetical protein
MWWPWIAVLVGGGVWLLAPDLAQAGAWRYAKHLHLPPVYESHSRPSKGSPRQEMSFETLRMLSTGMTQAEVLSRAGAPRQRFQNRGTQRWIYTTSENWIVEVVFSGNTVIEINWSRL